MYYTLFLALLWASGSLWAQDCRLALRGYVYDAGTDAPLELATVYVAETGGGAVTDSTGYFQLTDLCDGAYHLTINHVGCEAEEYYVALARDTTLTIRLEHTVTALRSIEVRGEAARRTTQAVTTLREPFLLDNTEANLADLLETVVGVSTLRTGGNIGKPVVHGLYGNRLTILNNGIAQSGQQWGNDHSPEIDPLVANKLRVVKGTAALAYPGSNLGSVILVEPRKIGREPHLHGRAAYFYETNGRGHAANLQLQRYKNDLGWRLNGTLKRRGDLRTADYFLRNTGTAEANLALQLEKALSKRTFLEIYASTFNTTLGVLRGAHIGNTTDLEAALTRPVPFFTEPDFSYRIEAPRQRVAHQLLKAKAQRFLADDRWVELTVASQYNHRREFDRRRGGRSEVPALALRQFTLFGEGNYHHGTTGGLTLDAGTQLEFVDNTNSPGTGVLPLIPDYYRYGWSGYGVASLRRDRHFAELGLRYDGLLQRVVTVGRDVGLNIARFDNTFHNFNLSGGYTYSFDDAYSAALNLGYGTRNPAINELYSQGLHQGVSSIEEGDPDLRAERALKVTLGLNANPGERLAIEVLAYRQRIEDYIYLAPQAGVRLTIRGAFPVFAYEQTDAVLTGVDLLGHYQLTEQLRATAGFSYLHATDRTNRRPLLFVPANTLTGQLRQLLPDGGNLLGRRLQNTQLEASVRHVFQQDPLLAEQDFSAPPAAYTLVGLQAGTDLLLDKGKLRLTLKADNLFNVAYRDYLNRQRYFADDPGRNVVGGISWVF